MISASQASSISSSDPVERAIRRAAEKGEYHVSVMADGEMLKVYEPLLKENGYAVQKREVSFGANGKACEWTLLISWR